MVYTYYVPQALPEDDIDQLMVTDLEWIRPYALRQRLFAFLQCQVRSRGVLENHQIDDDDDSSLLSIDVRPVVVISFMDRAP